MDKIICLGKNYWEHAQEMGEAQPERPVIFLKPPSVLVSAAKLEEGLALSLPLQRGSVHHECEIVLRLGKTNEIEAVTLGLDMTLRDVQSELKKKGQPWTVSKVFSHSAVIGPWIPLNDFKNWEQTQFEFFLNGKLRQSGSSQDMMLKPEEMVSYLEGFFPLCQGDLIFTGTPAGVGPVVSGDSARLSWGPIEYEVHWK